MGTPNREAIRAAARRAMPATMASAEAELAEIQRAQGDLCTEIRTQQDIASGVFKSALRFVSEDDRRAAQSRLDSLNAEAVRLDRSAAAVRERIRSCSSENASAVRDAIIPLRKAAAERIVCNINELTSAIDALNASGLALKEAGIRAVSMPAPLLSGMLAIAQSIIAASAPEEEKH
ncbi:MULTISPECIES: hypothetical protein [Bradyrhizobium]|uniref:hypothetical protein n=1 Tax=Bradyrhizobium elkanii TaxID=29448 RepID=UPI00271506B2|nr:hypothetical protein [Bradyrhizobium elkanii]WLB82414.1 hypothetical protein QIH83_07470 [Bradyrhizobium elkanii]